LSREDMQNLLTYLSTDWLQIGNLESAASKMSG